MKQEVKVRTPPPKKSPAKKKERIEVSLRQRRRRQPSAPRHRKRRRRKLRQRKLRQRKNLNLQLRRRRPQPSVLKRQQNVQSLQRKRQSLQQSVRNHRPKKLNRQQSVLNHLPRKLHRKLHLRQKEAPKASSPLPLSTEQIWTLTNYFYLALFAVALIPDSFGLNDKAHSFLIPGADTADKDTFTRFCTMLGLFGYINLSGARPQNLATACASMSFTFTLWTYMAHTKWG